MTELTITYKSRSISLSKNFLDTHNAWDNLPAIKGFHLERMKIEYKMEITDCSLELKSLFKEWTKNEFQLQESYGFPRNAHYHRFWRVPKCKCPRMDNEESYGTKYGHRSEECPIHGEDL